MIILILALALALRLYKLDHLTPYIDEFYHLTGGKRLFLEGTFNYPRAPFLTWLIGSLFKLYGNTSLYIARLPSAIIGSITVIPLYFLARKIHPYIGLLSALIFAILPVCIGMSRSIREYPFFFFIFIIFINWFIWTIDILQENWRNKKGIINLALLLSLPGIYFLFLDVSNFIIQLYITLFVIFSVFQVFRLLKKQYLSYSKIIDFLKMHYTRVLIILVAIFSILALLVSRVSWVISFSVPKNLLHFEKINYFDAIFNPSFNPWGESLMWFSRSNYPMLFILLIFLIPILVLRKNRVLLSYAASFIFILTTFLYFINRYYAIRYISYAFPFYIVIFGCSIYLLLKLAVLFPKKNNRIVYSVFICLLLSSIFSITPAIEGLKNEQVASIDPKTEMLGYDYPDLFKKLNELGFVDGDYLITSEGLREALTYYFNRYSFISDPKQYPDMRIEYTGNSQPVYDYSTIMSYYTSMPYYSRPCTDQVCDINEKQRIENMINEQPHGWIIIDKDRNRNWNTQGFPIQDFYNDRKLVSYKGSTDGYRGFDIYNW
ncbi:MAG: hypothetical protein KBB16_02480 [Candidatus Pacebacteria bacterium]|nr:hypothetical protein [Candidatus Paceibacterota bacterium]